MSSSPGDTDDSKRNSLELESEHAQRVQGAEPGQAPPTRLKERQKFFEEAFQQDMEHYLTTGYLQVAERREPIGSMSSMEVNVDLLEQMDLMDMSDHEALDVFLTSGGEETTALSPGMGPDGEVSLLVPCPPGRGPAPHHGDHDDAPCTVVVTLDDEDVHPDTALVDATPSPGSPGNQTRKD